MMLEKLYQRRTYRQTSAQSESHIETDRQI